MSRSRVSPGKSNVSRATDPREALRCDYINGLLTRRAHTSLRLGRQHNQDMGYDNVSRATDPQESFWSGVNQRLKYGVDRRLGLYLSIAEAVAFVSLSTRSSSAGLVFTLSNGLICRSASSPKFSQSAWSYAFFFWCRGSAGS